MRRKCNHIPKVHVKKDDVVLVIAGKDKGRKGRVLKVYPRKQRVLVEGVNIVIKHTKPSAKHPDGGRIEMEMPLHISNVMVVSPKTGEPSRVGRKRDDNGKWVRYLKKTGEILK